VISLGAGASLHGINLGGGDLGVKITGDDVDICGVGIGIVHDGDGYVLPLPPAHAALHVDGARATIRRNYLGGAVVVSSHGSDTRIGDTLDGSGDANDGIRDAWVSVLTDARDTGGPCASSTTAAQRVTIRDRFPRGLACLERPGVSGGDDVINHVNNWAATPIIDSASTADGTTVHVTGTASPLSVVDIYLDYAVEIDRRTTIADADGMFSYSGPLPPGEVVVYAVSTLNDPAHPNRRGSSSEWAGPLPVIMDGAEPLLSSLGSVIDLSGAGTGPARPGDILRFTVTMTNVGTVNVTNINGTNFLPPAATTILIGSGKAQGQGSGFIAIGGGFSNDTLAPGRAETYTVDALVKPTASPGMAVFSLEVNGNGIVATPVVGRMRIVTGPAPLLSPRIWLAFVSG
jgi:uncharacterized repeat protein (TIGR01451 family)